MLLDAGQLSRYYGTPAGQAVRRAILARLARLWPDVDGLRLLGYGFALPYIETCLDRVERAAALMPAPMGVVPWPKPRPLSVLADEAALPFPDAFFDRILVIHGIEGAESARILLRGLWRLLAPEGRILIVAPNRTSLWAIRECSPFALGRPFRKGELDRLLREAMFAPVRWEKALYAPPCRGWPPIWMESLGRRIAPGLAGVQIVEARKSLYAPLTLSPAVETGQSPALA